MLVVMPAGDNSFYMDRADGKALFPPMDGPEFVDGIRQGATGKYETYISKSDAYEREKHLKQYGSSLQKLKTRLKETLSA